MELPSPKDLKALLKVCRDYGVDSVEVGALKVKFGDMPHEGKSVKQEELELGPDGLPLPPGITADDMVMWSSAPDPLQQRLNQPIPGSQ